jgi:hypothetical protein
VDTGGIVALVVAVVVIAALLGTLGWERYRPRVQAEHPLPTTEVFLDPVTHRRMRVWIDPGTGAREYREELETTATALPPLERPGLLLPPEAEARPPRQLPPAPPPPGSEP